MQIIYKLVSTTKAGNQAFEMEDAAWPNQSSESSLDHFCFAVADGATQGSHSGPWAQQLCRAFVESADPCSPEVFAAATVPVAREHFLAWEKAYLADRQTQGRALQWFEEAVIGSGAYATLVGVCLAVSHDQQTVCLKALAIGDSCLFVFRESKCIASFPLTASEQFAGAPLLIASQASHNLQMQDGLHGYECELLPGDKVFVCTDALAAWLLRQHEMGEHPSEDLVAMLSGDDSQQVFEEFLAKLRQDKQIRNDDVTLAVVDIRA